MKIPATFDVSELEHQFDRLGRRARDFDNNLLTMLLLEHVEEVFDSQGASGQDGSWDALLPSTIARHPNRASGQLLFDTGVLSNFQSATRGDLSIVWSPANYAVNFATGTRNMVKRNPFAVNQKDYFEQAEHLLVTEIGH